MLLVQIDLYGRMKDVERSFQQYVLITALGSYECLFVHGRPRVLNEVSRLLRQVMHCPHCQAPVRPRKGNGARFLQAQKLDCRACGLEHDFPLFWLLSKTEWSLFGDPGDGSDVLKAETGQRDHGDDQRRDAAGQKPV